MWGTPVPGADDFDLWVTPNYHSTPTFPPTSKWFSAPVPVSLWLCFFQPEATGRTGPLGFSEGDCVPCHGWSRTVSKKWVQIRAKARARSEQTGTTHSWA